MKSEELLDAICEARDEYVEDICFGKTRKRSVRVRWLVAAAACLALVFGLKVLHQSAPTSDLPDLPMLTLTENGEAWGFEGFMAHDASELVSSNPWTEGADLSVLPVYRNPHEYDGAGLMLSGDTAQIEAYRDAVAARVSGAQVTVEDGMTVLVEFDPTVSLPEGYRFEDYAAFDEVETAAEYLMAVYGDLLDMAHPTANIYGGDFDINGNQTYHLSVFDSAGDLTDQIIQYNFCSVSFYPDEGGSLWLIRLRKPDLSDKIGDYPIISEKDAETLLKKGKYITSVPYEFTADMRIGKVELVYRTRLTDRYFIPYYRFVGELPEDEINGMKQYGAYYVPAVMEQYIENMPLWDGSFN